MKLRKIKNNRKRERKTGRMTEISKERQRFLWFGFLTYVVPSISFQTFLHSMLLLYILWDDWPIFMILGSNEQTPLSTTPSLSQIIWPRWSSIPHPLYSLDLAPCDFCLFLKLRGCRYETIEELKEAVTKVIDTLTQEDFHGAFQKLL